MGKLLVKYYSFVKKKKGYIGQLELAQKTKIPSTKAPSLEDTEELVRRFHVAAEEITGEIPPRFSE